MSKNKNNNKLPKKKKFELQDDETIEACLDRIKKEGYQPMRRTEKPVFKEKNGDVEPVGSTIVFDAVLAKHER
ncbi:NETI motif-containing protein [Gracilibacillus sp. YIM 98692]|uniref:NETI motif-containing protein n=1 Tax=Gracilibacillus sp. YIM 98692 TaxID=2663532 RepID=UPI001F08EC18|nr:NETI motif-containing protein [Gracilibacillus sp. YIM 98692]